MYVCVRRNFGSFFVRCNACQGRAYGDAVMRVRPLAARGKQARACRDVPDDIREHLPEELSNLPADLIFAANLLDHECSRSAPLRRIARAYDWISTRLRSQYGGVYAQWPPWAVDTISSLRNDYTRVHQMQKDAMRRVQKIADGPGGGEGGEGGIRASVRARTH